MEYVVIGRGVLENNLITLNGLLQKKQVFSMA